MPSVRLCRRYQAPAAEVFRALTDGDELAAWFWPPPFTTVAAVDLREGGSYAVRSTGLPEGHNMGVTGRILEVTSPERVVTTWRWDGEDEASTVTITVTDLGDGVTELVVSHDGLASAEARENHMTGWADCLDRLTDWLGSR